MQKIRPDGGNLLGQNIRKLRLSCGMTQEAVVTRMQLMGCDLSRSIYSQMECGAYNIRASELAALKIIFKADYGSFFEGLEEGLLDGRA